MKEDIRERMPIFKFAIEDESSYSNYYGDEELTEEDFEENIVALTFCVAELSGGKSNSILDKYLYKQEVAKEKYRRQPIIQKIMLFLEKRCTNHMKHAKDVGKSNVKWYRKLTFKIFSFLHFKVDTIYSESHNKKKNRL